MLGSLTVLPAVLSKLGDKVEKGRVPVHRPAAPPQPRRVARVGLDPRPRAAPPGRLASSPPAASCSRSRIPALNMHTVNPGVAGLPHDLPIMQTYDRIQAAFPGGPLPAVVVVQAEDVTTPAGPGRASSELHKALATGQMSEPVTRRPARTRRSRSSRSRSPGNGTDDTSDAALATLRDDVDPGTRSARSPASRPTSPA